MGMRRQRARQLDLQTPHCLVAEGQDLRGRGTSVVNVPSSEGRTSSKKCSASVSEVYLSGSLWPFGGLEPFTPCFISLLKIELSNSAYPRGHVFQCGSSRK